MLVSMRLSSSDRKSAEAEESIRFAADSHDSHPYSETDSTSYPRETGDNSDDNVLMVERDGMGLDAAAYKETR